MLSHRYSIGLSVVFVSCVAAWSQVGGVAVSKPVTTSSAPASRPSSAPAVNSAGKWITSYAQATKEATASNRLILADFTGTDWCVWCKKLKAEVFDTPAFKDWAAKNVILLELDFPRAKPQDGTTKKQNQELLEKHKVEGFPTVVFLKADGTSVGRTGYVAGGPTAWIAKAREILDAAQKIEK